MPGRCEGALCHVSVDRLSLLEDALWSAAEGEVSSAERSTHRGEVPDRNAAEIVDRLDASNPSNSHRGVATILDATSPSSAMDKLRRLFSRFENGSILAPDLSKFSQDSILELSREIAEDRVLDALAEESSRSSSSLEETSASQAAYLISRSLDRKCARHKTLVELCMVRSNPEFFLPLLTRLRRKRGCIFSRKAPIHNTQTHTQRRRLHTHTVDFMYSVCVHSWRVGLLGSAIVIRGDSSV